MAYHEDPALPGYWFYAGLRIQAPVETHRFAVRYLRKRLPPGAPVLDVAAGEGALAKQLQDAGLAPVCTSWNKKLKVEAPRYHVNLDHPFSTDEVGGRRFPGICAIEIAEHVENPSALLRSLAGALEPGGVLIVSTPNVESVAARMQWLLRGYPRSFGEHEVRANRHISMLWSKGMKVLIERAGLRVVEKRLLGRTRMARSWKTPFKRAGYALLERVLPGDTKGTTRVYVLEHAEAGAAGGEADRVY